MLARSPSLTYQSGKWEIDLARRELRAGGVAVPIGGRTFDIVEVLVQAEGDIVTKDGLMARVWPGAVVGENTLQVHMSALRKALGPDRGMLKTVFGRGYRLLGEWSVERESPGRGRVTATAEVIPIDGRSARPPSEAKQASDARRGALTVVPAESTPTPGNLPTVMTELIGRDVARQQIADRLSAHRVVTLVGPGGIGKTRLAVAVANDRRQEFSDHVWFADLAPLSDADLVPSVVASALGLDFGGGDITAAQVARAIGDMRCLIVLDNCEHVIDAAARTAETIVRTCRVVSILATGREPLRIDGEDVYRVLPLEVPAADQVTSKRLLDYSAVQLFLARLQAIRLTQDDQPPDPESVATICRRLDGIPLAIELAAASAATLGLTETIRHLNDRFQLLVGGRRTAPARQRTLLATLDWSYDLLSETERLILMHLAVFSGGFTLDAICAVAARPLLNLQELLDGVAGLATKSLVSVDLVEGATRYSLLDTVRAYAAAKLAASGETDATMRRHALFYAELLKQAQAHWLQQSVEEWFATYRREIDNVRTALDWAFSEQGNSALAVTLTINAIPLMFDLSLVAECHRHAERALQLVKAAAEPDRRSEMYLLAALQATHVYTEGPSAASSAAWETVLQLATELDDNGGKFRALRGLWNDRLCSGSPAAALVLARRFMDLVTRLGDPTTMLLGHRIIGISLHYIGDQPSARIHLNQIHEQYSRAVHRLQTIGSRLDHGTAARATLARVLWLQGEPDEALRLSNVAKADAFADDHLLSLLYVLVESVIPLSLVLGDYEETGRSLEILMERATRGGFRIWQIYGRCFREVLRIRQGDGAPGGIQRFIEAIRDLRNSGFCAHLPMFLCLLATDLADAGRETEALSTIDEAIDWSESRGARWYGPELLRSKADIILRTSSPAAAIEAEARLRQALAQARQQGALAWELRAATSLARLLRQQGHAEAACDILSPIYARFSEGFDTPDLISARDLLN